MKWQEADTFIFLASLVELLRCIFVDRWPQDGLCDLGDVTRMAQDGGAGFGSSTQLFSLTFLRRQCFCYHVLAVLFLPGRLRYEMKQSLSRPRSTHWWGMLG